MRQAKLVPIQAVMLAALACAAAAVHASIRPIVIHRLEAARAAEARRASGPNEARASATNPRAVGSSSGASASAPSANTISEDPFRPIALEDARALFNNGRAIFVDARPREEYEAGHVAGAFWLPFEAFAAGRPRVLDLLSAEVPLVIYCEGGDCHVSTQVAEMLADYGFRDLRVLTDGWPAWKTAQLPEETGPAPVMP